MFNKIKEECGIFGVYSKKPEKLAYMTCVGLSALQHRGEESCGIAVNTDGVISYHKDQGLVSDVFTNEAPNDMFDELCEYVWDLTGNVKVSNASVFIKNKII